jgi:hypothetical protein
MKNLLCALLLLVVLPALAAEDDEGELTGDKKSACEAILCLSSGQRPDECDPAIKKFYSIKKKTTSKTIKAREDFLSKCPVVDEDKEMKKRVGEIARGAGRCDAAYLNQTLREVVTIKECNTITRNGNRFVSQWVPVNKNTYCANPRTRQVTVIGTNKPAYCTAYDSHEWTYNLQTRYVGDKMSGGHWVDAQ